MYLGDFKEDGDIFFKFTTRAFATGIPTLLAGTPVLSVYKDEGGAATEKTTGEAYFDLDVSHDSIAGWNNVRVDLSGDAFFATGADYSIVITTGTVGGVSVVGENIANFSIENRSMGQPAGATLAADIAAVKTETASILAGTVTNAQGADVATDVAAMIDVNNRVDIGSWLGSAVTLSTGNQPDVNVDRIDDVAVSTVATAGRLHVLDDAGATVATEAKQDTAQTELDKIGVIPALDTAAQTIGAAIGKLADNNAGADYVASTDSLQKIRDDRTLAAADYTIVADLGTVQSADHTAGIADIPTVAEFEARTIVAANYVVVGDTLARVTLVDTTTTNTDLVTAAAVKTAMEADGGDLSSLMEALVNKLLITEANGNAELFNDAGASQGTVAAAITSVAGVTQRKRMLI